MKTLSNPRISAANLVMAPRSKQPADMSGRPVEPPASLSPIDTDSRAAFQRIRAIHAKCDENKHTRALVAIHACIDEGINTRGRIVGALKTLDPDLDRRHVNITLDKGTGSNPDLHWWSCDADGIYTTLPLPDPAVSAAHITL